MQRALFISDLHLSDERPAINERFFRFLREEASRTATLYVLGDLFEYWIGDDELESPGGEALAASVSRALRALVESGVKVCVMHGNRDFLLADRFLTATAAVAIPDPSVVVLGGVRTLLMHGDTLCSADHAYQRFRARVRDPRWQRAFLAKPLADRRIEALGLRRASERDKRRKSATMTDVCEADVVAAFRRYRVEQMIHGHTHRPAHHALEVDGRHCLRWVLPDWYERGGYLVAESGALRLHLFESAG